MRLERAGLVETQAAVFALVGALARVAAPVPVEVTAVLEPPRAKATVVGLLPRVNSNVASQVGTVRAVVLAVRALYPHLLVGKWLDALREGVHSSQNEGVLLVCAEQSGKT